MTSSHTPVPTRPRRLAVIGAGWAGLAAAVAAAGQGLAVTVWEAARTPGGRARSVAFTAAPGLTAAHTTWQLDNGQHILIGAYRASLALMRTVGVDAARSLRRLPLDLRDGQGHGLALPRLPHWLSDRLPAHLAGSLAGALGILRARGWSLGERAALLQALHGWQRQGFRCAADLSVAQLCQRLPVRIQTQLIEPLCTAALNTPMERASAQVFLRVLQDSFTGGPGSADLLLPTVPLGALLAEPACQWLVQHGAQLRLGARVRNLVPVDVHGQACAWRIHDEVFDAVILATPAPEAARLLAPLAAHGTPAQRSACTAWLDAAGNLQHEPIGTVYLLAQGLPPHHGHCTGLLTRPMLAANGAAQFLFDRQALSGDTGVLACVASTLRLERAALEQAVLAQVQQAMTQPDFLHPGLGQRPDWRVLGSVVEKRATFACATTTQRPGPLPHTGLPTLAVCGDYIQGPYPATLEGAVLSGQQALALLCR